jgi:AmiR/NasT family two-component response regulator
MSKAFRVVIADDEPELLEFYRSVLTSLGHTVVAQASCGEELVDRCRAAHPDLVMSDIKMPGKDGVQAVMEVFRHAPVRVILVTAYHAPSHIHGALDEMVLAYLAKPFRPRELEWAIDRADRRFEEFSALQQQCADPRQAIASRKTLRLAKGILMKRDSLGDREAFKRLQQLAREQQISLVDMAKRLIASDQRDASLESTV